MLVHVQQNITDEDWRKNNPKEEEKFQEEKDLSFKIDTSDLFLKAWKVLHHPEKRE